MRMKWIIMLCIVVLLAGCRTGPPWQAWRFEGPQDMDEREYPPLYIQGWQDGCESGTSGSANHYYKFFYKFKQDATLAQNRIYYKGWKDAFDYCQRYTSQWNFRRFL